MKLLPDRVRRPILSLYERRVLNDLDPAGFPHHVAIICDGNRRWAREAGFEDVSHGHRVGAQRIADMLGWCADLGIGTVTIYLLSIENLSRKSDELDALMEIVPDIVDEIARPTGNWQVRIVGTLDPLPEDVAERLRRASERTTDHGGMNVNVAVGYGGRQEIVDAVQALLRERAAAADLVGAIIGAGTAEAIDRNPYTGGGCRASCSGRAPTRRSGSPTLTGPSSGAWTSCARCATSPPAPGGSASSPDLPARSCATGPG